jgi:hypothetical protein
MYNINSGEIQGGVLYLVTKIICFRKIKNISKQI